MSFAAKNETNPAVIDATGYTPYVRARSASRDSRGGIANRKEDAVRAYWDHQNFLADLQQYSVQHERELFRSRWECDADKKSLYSRVRWEMDKVAAGMEEDLERRRNRLAEVLKSEEEMYLDEICRGSHEDPEEKKARMLSRYVELKTQKELERKKLAEEKREQQFRRNCNELRQLVSHKIHHETAEEGKKLLLEKEQEAQAKQAEERMYEELWQRDCEAKQQKDEKEEEYRKKIRVKYAEEVSDQILQKKLEKQKRRQDVETEAALMEEHKRLLELEEQSQKEMKKRKQAELKVGLDSCVRSKLKKKSKDVQDDLLQDLFFMKQIMEDQAEAEKNEKKKALLHEQQQFLKYLQDQVAKEAAFEKEVDKMYQEELDKMWERKDREWKEEKARRRQKEQDVIDEVKAQIEAHMSRALKMQEMSKLYGQKVLEEDASDKEKAMKKLMLIRERNISHQKELLEQIREKEQKIEQDELKKRMELERIRREREQEEAKIEKLLMEMKIDREHPYRTRRKEIRKELGNS
ncbi:cilia- and flagella-associated protein 53-like [Uloborus diversus]|uniref:cilia- and flagella-associated protein 53-like n=1 Tax=Uloborus diversus TaxID=327109 RepID=UPI0024096947|nr:cilia- and flagella-associated protein 53-like [Uloborus diversus]